MSITQVISTTLVVLSLSFLVAFIATLKRDSVTRHWRASDMLKGIVEKQVRELLKTFDRGSNITAPARYLSEALGQYFIIEGFLNRHVAQGNLDMAIRNITKDCGSTSVLKVSIVSYSWPFTLPKFRFSLTGEKKGKTIRRVFFSEANTGGVREVLPPIS
jgi:hypothetical protein